MSTTLRDDLASLKIDRRGPSYKKGSTGKRRGGDGFLKFLTLLLWLIPLGIVGGGAAIAYQQYANMKARPEVSIALVQAMTAGEAEKVLSAKGYIRSRYQAAVGTKVPGRVEKLMVEEGSKVEKGQLIAELEHNEIDAILASRQAQKSRILAEIQEAKVDLANKERKATRQTRLYQQQSLSVDEVDKAITDREMAESKVAALEAGVKVVEAQIREIEESLRNLRIYAPFSGTVTSKAAEVGETINTMSLGASGGRSAIIEIADLEHLDVDTDVAESALSRVSVDQPAVVTVSAAPGRTYSAKVRKIIPMGDRARGTIKVKVEILDPDDRLFPELVATVNFLPPDKARDRSEDNVTALFIPKDALVKEGDLTYAWVLDRKDLPHRKEIRVTEVEGNVRVESGLEAGERVILSPSANLRESSPVRISD